MIEILLFLFLSLNGTYLSRLCVPLEKLGCIIINNFLGILPGLYLVYYSFRKKVSDETKRKLNKTLLFSLLILVISIVAGAMVYYIHNDSGNSVFASFGIIMLSTGIFLIRRVYSFSKAGRLRFFREGTVGLGFHEVSKEKSKYSLSLQLAMMTALAIFLIGGGAYWIIIGLFNIY